MNLIVGLLVLLAACIVLGVIRKLRGGTFLPPPETVGEHHVQDHKTGRWWRYADDGSLEEAFRRPKKKR
jgi:hypothetical protein